MATEGTGLIEGGNLIAGADLSAKQYFAVTASTATDRMVVVSGAGDDAVGILQNKPTSGLPAEVKYMGYSKAVAGATITTGARLMTDASGKLIPSTGTNHCVGRSVQSAATSDIFLMQFGSLGTVA